MLFNQAEMMTLRLIGWCKDAPADITDNFKGVYVFSKECVDELSRLKLVYTVKETQSLRLTPMGYHLLDAAGIGCAADKSYEGRENIITRRHMSARVCATMLMAGIDVFTRDVTALPQGGYLSMSTMRRKNGQNIAGSTKLLGLCSNGAEAFRVFYPDASRIYFRSEQTTSNKLLSQVSRKSSVIYAGTDYFSLYAAITGKPEQRSRGPITYRQAYDQFSVPVHLLPCNSDGAFQLRVMTQPDYRRKIINEVLPSDEVDPPKSSQIECDGTWYGVPYIFSLDMDFKRVNRVVKAAGTNGVCLFVLPCQGSLYRELFHENKRVRCCAIDIDAVMSALGFDSLLVEPDNEVYVTENSEVIDTLTIRRLQEAHKPGRKRKDTTGHEVMGSQE